MADYQQLLDHMTGQISTTILRRAKYGIHSVMGKPLRDLTGQRFGFLVALCLGQKLSGGGNGAWWLCRCDCGAEKSIRGHDLVEGKIRSCGCQQQWMTDLRRKTHGRSKNDRTYRIWQAMLTRCRNPNVPCFGHYGGRGITVCDRWTSFEAFLADMGEAPARQSIERIDNAGNYEPANCRWATQREQANNTRTNVFIEWRGERLTRSQWERKLGLAPTSLRQRLRAGWPMERAMQPLGGKDGC